MKKLFIWASLFSGVAAAYLMYKRGDSLGSIASKTLTNPVGSLVNEIQRSV